MAVKATIQHGSSPPHAGVKLPHQSHRLFSPVFAPLSRGCRHGFLPRGLSGSPEAQWPIRSERRSRKLSEEGSRRKQGIPQSSARLWDSLAQGPGRGHKPPHSIPQRGHTAERSASPAAVAREQSPSGLLPPRDLETVSSGSVPSGGFSPREDGEEVPRHASPHAQTPAVGNANSAPFLTSAEALDAESDRGWGGARADEGEEKGCREAPRLGLELGFTRRNELTVGRLAMLGFAASLCGEGLTGRGILAQLNLETGIPICEAEPLLLFFILFTLIGAVRGLDGRGNADFRNDSEQSQLWPRPKFRSVRGWLGLRESGPLFAFSRSNEMFVGRLAQLGIAFSLLGELLTGKGALAQLRFETGIPVLDVESLLILSIAFFFLSAIDPETERFYDVKDDADE